MSERNLYQRLIDIAGEVRPVPATGKTAQGQRTSSIADVEGSLQFLFFRHKVLTWPQWNTPPVVVETYTTDKGKDRPQLWQGDVTIVFVNPDNPEERFEARVVEHGSNPSAIVSFARKIVYRTMFHLASEADEGRPIKHAPVASRAASQQEAQVRVPSGAPSTVAISAATDITNIGFQTSEGVQIAKDLVNQAQEILNPPMSAEEFDKSLKRLHIGPGKATFTAARLFQKPINLEDLTGEQRAQLVAELEGVVISKATGRSA